MLIKENLAVCAIDVGTSSVRVSAFSYLGQNIPDLFVQMQYQMNISQQGAVEIPAEELFEKVASCLDIFLTKLRLTKYSVIGLGISTIWHSILVIDQQYRILSPLISWNDTRSSPFAKILKIDNDEAYFHQITGCRFHASYWPAKISWLQSIGYSKSRDTYFLSFGDYIFLRLFGEIVTSVSLASGTGLFNQYECDWEGAVVEKLSIDLKQLPCIKEIPFSGLRKEFASRWPELKDVLWFLPVGDGACNNVGSNCFSSNEFAMMIGTSGAMRTIFTNRSILLPSGLWAYKVDRERNIIGGAMSNAGNLFAWLQTTLNFSLEMSNLSIEEGLKQIKPASHGLTVLPFLSGERSLGWNDDAKGAVLGLELATKPGDILLAGLEAVAYQFLLIYQEMTKVLGEPEKIIATGAGLYNSEVWPQIIADVFGKDIYISQELETSSRGAALLVLEKLGFIKLLENTTSGKVYTPKNERVSVYQEAFERYVCFYNKLVSSN